jgi:xylan 1,4-beta-xylosidase
MERSPPDATRVRTLVAAALLLLAPAIGLDVPAHAQTSGGRTYINPLDIDYKYNFEQLNDGISYRSSADPVIVPHGNEYYLFATIAGGYWRSPNLADWEFITPNRWPMEDIVAPAAASVNGTIYLYLRAAADLQYARTRNREARVLQPLDAGAAGSAGRLEGPVGSGPVP